MHKFKFSILTPEKSIFSGEVLSVNLPTKDGEITVLANHTPIISVMSIGEVKIKLLKENGAEESEVFHLQGGVLKVDESGEVLLLSDSYVEIDNFNQNNLNAEIERAKIAMQEKVDDEAFAEFEGELERYLYIDKILKRKR